MEILEILLCIPVVALFIFFVIDWYAGGKRINQKDIDRGV